MFGLKVSAAHNVTPEIRKSMLAFLKQKVASFDNDTIYRVSVAAVSLASWVKAQERRTFVPQGWSKFYEFSSGDLRAGATIVQLICEESQGESIAWESLHGLMENAAYSGRVDNPYDIRVLVAYLRKYFTDKVIQGRSPLAVDLSCGNLSLPVSSSRDAYIRIIENLPSIDAPSLFGLPKNVERSLQRVRSSLIIKQLRALFSSGTSAEKFDREKWRVHLGPLLDMWSKLYTN